MSTLSRSACHKGVGCERCSPTVYAWARKEPSSWRVCGGGRPRADHIRQGEAGRDGSINGERHRPGGDEPTVTAGGEVRRLGHDRTTTR